MSRVVRGIRRQASGLTPNKFEVTLEFHELRHRMLPRGMDGLTIEVKKRNGKTYHSEATKLTAEGVNWKGASVAFVVTLFRDAAGNFEHKRVRVLVRASRVGRSTSYAIGFAWLDLAAYAGRGMDVQSAGGVRESLALSKSRDREAALDVVVNTRWLTQAEGSVSSWSAVSDDVANLDDVRDVEFDVDADGGDGGGDGGADPDAFEGGDSDEPPVPPDGDAGGGLEPVVEERGRLNSAMSAASSAPPEGDGEQAAGASAEPQPEAEQAQAQAQPQSPSAASEHEPQPGQPPWDADSTSSACTACRKQFRIYRRRHHCRRCGHLFCEACAPSDKLKLIPQFKHVYKTPVRHCSTCFAIPDPQYW